MPAFTFEKITPPVRPDPAPVVTIREPRGVIARMFDRFTESRVPRVARKAGLAGFTEADIAPPRIRRP
ncbi:MAG: hypothetical protein J0G37_01435 [Afipia sp.]|nr:hypothetical protein [Afipia sp.]